MHPYISATIKHFTAAKETAEKVFVQLADEDFYAVPVEGLNSIAVLIRHLHGNMCSRWTNFLTEDGEKPWRVKALEFETPDASRETLMEWWEAGWGCLLSTLASLTEDDLNKTVIIRQQPVGVYDAIQRQLSHYATHVGQLIYIGKWAKGAAWQAL